MADDRELRNELEKVQGEVLRLKKTLASPAELGAGQKARIESLRRAKQQQVEKLKDAQTDLALLRQALQAAKDEELRLHRELEAVRQTEHGLVYTTVRKLDPGPSRAGCMTLAVMLALCVLGWLA